MRRDRNSNYGCGCFIIIIIVVVVVVFLLVLVHVVFCSLVALLRFDAGGGAAVRARLFAALAGSAFALLPGQHSRQCAGGLLLSRAPGFPPRRPPQPAPSPGHRTFFHMLRTPLLYSSFFFFFIFIFIFIFIFSLNRSLAHSLSWTGSEEGSRTVGAVWYAEPHSGGAKLRQALRYVGPPPLPTRRQRQRPHGAGAHGTSRRCLHLGPPGHHAEATSRHHQRCHRRSGSTATAAAVALPNGTTGGGDGDSSEDWDEEEEEEEEDDVDLHLLRCKLIPLVTRAAEDGDWSVREEVACDMGALCLGLGERWSMVLIDLVQSLMRDHDDLVSE